MPEDTVTGGGNAAPPAKTYDAEYVRAIREEAKGHRLNADRAANDAAAAKEAHEAAIKVEREKVTAAEAKASEATKAAQQRAVNADLKVAAKDAGANDVSDVLALIDRGDIKTNADGDIENAPDLIAGLKKAKPYLFGGQSTSSATPPPPQKPPEAKDARKMTPAEYDAAKAEMKAASKPR